MNVQALLTFCIGVLFGMTVHFEKSLLPNVSESCAKRVKKKPLFLFPLIKELRAGWGNMAIPTMLRRNATGTGTLVVDIGLDKGVEFFAAIDSGFEVVGFEANPKTVEILSPKCQAMSNCQVLDLATALLPLQRSPGMSYLIEAGMSNKTGGNLTFYRNGPISSFVQAEGYANNKYPNASVSLFRLDDIIREDVWMLKVDTQGFDHFVLEGARRIFEDYTVRQLIFEVDPYLMHRAGISIEMTLKMLRDYGMICFSSFPEQECDYLGDSAEGYKQQVFDTVGQIPYKGNLWSSCFDDFF